MIFRLVLASVRQRPARSLLLLVGYALGVGVTIALLSIGGALVAQARDQQLVGGGDLVVLPAGIDLETLKTGGVSSMFFTVDQAPFLYREVLTSPRFGQDVEAVAPWIEDELVYLEHEGALVPASAGGVIPSVAERLGAGPTVVDGSWEDLPVDRSWMSPTDRQLYADMDALHLPTGEAVGDSTWAEWHYFNVRLPDDGWLYLTYMLAGALPDGRWGGRMLATLVRPGEEERVFETIVEPAEVTFAAGAPDLRIGASSVVLETAGTYRLTADIPDEGEAGRLRLDLEVKAATRRYMPPLDVGGGAFPSGYAVPMLDGRATGTICAAGRCVELNAARTYHDHNWGTWSRVTWDWGQAHLGDVSVLYGGVAREDGVSGSRFLYLADDLGFGGVYPIREIEIDWGPAGPRAISVHAGTGRDSLRLDVGIRHRRATDVPIAELERTARFYQMRGDASLTGRLRGGPIAVTGDGFFETWTREGSDPGAGPF